MIRILLLCICCLCTIHNWAQILPTPTSVQKKLGHFILREITTIGSDEFGSDTAIYLRDQLKKSTGFSLNFSDSSIDNGIVFVRDNSGILAKEESYVLDISEDLITIKAGSESGLFYGVQSLLQLFPVEVFSNEIQKNVNWKIACQRIEDKPKYGFRSFMLDSGRQYQSPEFIKKYLDYLALLKMNVFHWHLTEGQGWRIEIKKYPKLTSIGSQVAKGKEQQGYYTQEEIRDIVAYAAKKHITIVAEIDVPGHSEAAISAHPEFSCFGEVPETVMAFSSNIFCAGKEMTYEFLQGVLDEVVALFPGEYIHLGGDEAPKQNWNSCPNCQSKIKTEGLKNSHELQLYFSTRLANYLKTKHKKVLFWGDVIHNNWNPEGVANSSIQLPDNVIIHWWNYRRHKDETLKKALKKGYPVVANTNYYTYLNFPTTPWSKYAKNRTFDLKTIYEQNPSDIQMENELVLGMGACLWTDWYVQEYMIDRRVFPRIYALGQQMWYTGDKIPFDEFYENVKSKYKLLNILGIDYGPALTAETPENYKWD